MSDSGDHVHVEIVIVPDREMPEGIDVVPAERCGRLYWLVREKQITESARDQFNRMLLHLAGNGVRPGLDKVIR